MFLGLQLNPNQTAVLRYCGTEMATAVSGMGREVPVGLPETQEHLLPYLVLNPSVYYGTTWIHTS